jgi:hypothetical protein
MSDAQRQVTLDAVNRALKDLGDRFAAGEVPRDEYRTLRRQLVAEATGENGISEEEMPTGRHPAVKGDSKILFWLIPLALALVGVGGLLAFVWYLTH